MNYTFTQKIIALIFLILLGLMAGSGIIFLLLKSQGIDAASKDLIVKLLENSETILLAKSAIGLNHLIVFVLCPVIYIYIFYRFNYTDFLKTKSFNTEILFFFIILLFCTYPLMGYLAMVADQIHWPGWMQNMDKESMEALAGLLKMESPSDLIFNLFLVGILPGVGEEILFRGIIQNEIIKKTAKPVLSILITAIIFSAFHFQITGFLPKMLIGIILGFSYYVGKSIWIPIIIHALNNSFATLALYFSGVQSSDIKNIDSSPISFNAAMLSFLISGLLFWYILKKYKNPTIYEQERSP